MRKQIFFLVIFILICSISVVSAETKDKETIRVPALKSQGFGFQEKEFKVVKVLITGEKDAKSESDEKLKNLQGFCEIGGFGFILKLVTNSKDAIEADLMELPDPISSMTEKDGEKELEVPIGHISLTASKPDPKNRVFTGKLRIISEKAEGIKGEFDIYLNDNTPGFRKKKQPQESETSQNNSY